MKSYIYCILFFSFSLSHVIGQTIDFIASDTLNVRAFRAYEDTTQRGYYLKTPIIERANKKFRIYYDDQKKKIASESNYDNSGNPDTVKEWYENGQVEEIIDYQGNSAIYEYTSYFRNSKIKHIRKCNHDTCITLMYYENGRYEGKLQEKGTHLFYIEKYYKNGQKMFEPERHDSLNNSVIHEVLYYESGEILQDRYWMGGSLLGGFKEYYENRTIKISGQYESETQYRNSTKDSYRISFKIGKWSYYNDAGKLTKEEFYENDVIVKTNEF